MRPPVFGGDGNDLRAFEGGRVGLLDDRFPPINHAGLDRDWTGRRGVDHEPQAGHVVGNPGYAPAVEHPDEHRRDELPWVTRWRAIASRHPSGSNFSSTTVVMPPACTQRPHRRCGVVERRRARIDRIRFHAHLREERQSGLGVSAGDWPERSRRIPSAGRWSPTNTGSRSPSASSAIGVRVGVKRIRGSVAIRRGLSRRQLASREDRHVGGCRVRTVLPPAAPSQRSPERCC
jgi:hypothetical protein